METARRHVSPSAGSVRRISAAQARGASVVQVAGAAPDAMRPSTRRLTDPEIGQVGLTVVLCRLMLLLASTTSVRMSSAARASKETAQRIDCDDCDAAFSAGSAAP